MIRFKTTHLDKARALAHYAREQALDIRQDTQKTFADLGAVNTRTRIQGFLADCVIMAIQIPLDLETYSRYGKRDECAQAIRQRRIGLWLTQQAEKADVPVKHLHAVEQEHQAAEDIMEYVGILCAPEKLGVKSALGVNTLTKQLESGGLATLEHDQAFDRILLIERGSRDGRAQAQTVLFATGDLDIPFPHVRYPDGINDHEGLQLLIAAHTGWSVRSMVTKDDAFRQFQVGSAVDLLNRIEHTFGPYPEVPHVPSTVITK